MSLASALGIAGSGIDAIDRGFAVIGQNVANANTADWSSESADPTSLAAGSLGLGVRMLPTQRQIDTALQTATFNQGTAVAGLQTRSTALSNIDTAQGTVGSGDDLASLVGGLQTAFSTLQTDPSDQTQQQAVVAAAGRLASRINALGDAVTTTRQAAQDAAVSEVASVNTTLGSIGALSSQIMALSAQGQSTADLENQRDAAIDRLSKIIPVKAMPQSNGNALLATSSGLTLPTDQTAPLSLTQATLGPDVTYPASNAVPGVMLGGIDVTASLTGTSSGQLGANLALRDQTMPQYQAGLDEFADTLASRFDQQGLTLFSNASGTVPAATGPNAQSGLVGFAETIAVNPAVSSEPSLVRDGTHAVAGSATGASAFTPNPPAGPTGFTGMISRVLTYALGADAQDGVAQTPPAASGLGPAGDQAISFTPPADLPSFAASLAGALAQDGSNTSDALSAAQATQTSLQAKLTQSDGVSVDAEMSLMVQLQNAYGANARIISAVQSMWNSLLSTTT